MSRKRMIQLMSLVTIVGVASLTRPEEAWAFDECVAQELPAPCGCSSPNPPPNGSQCSNEGEIGYCCIIAGGGCICPGGS